MAASHNCYAAPVRTIPQRELRNNSAAVLREAEGGEEFVITVDGRPVAALGPYRKRQWVQRESVRQMLVTPTDATFLDEVRRDIDDDIRDPWA
jgi:prevent-host-death family protein